MGASDDLELLRTLKARYFRYLDTKRWSEWGELFAPEAIFIRDSTRLAPMVGRDEIVETVRTMLEGVVTVHHGHMPELALQAPDRATGIWSMEDLLITRAGPLTGRVMHGFGHYFEEYRKSDGVWRFVSIRLTRLHATITEQPRFTEYGDAAELSPGASARAEFGD